MASPCICRNLHLAGKDQFTEQVFIDGSDIPVIFYVFIPIPPQAPTPASAPGSLGRYTDENLQKATKLALKLFVKGQEHG